LEAIAVLVALVVGVGMLVWVLTSAPAHVPGATTTTTCHTGRCS
jgi:hypothetical protein